MLKMPNNTMRTSDKLDTRRRRTLFRCWHRGTKEMDMIFGPYANEHIETMSEVDLDAFEALISLEDVALVKWFMGQEPVPTDVDGPSYQSVLSFLHNRNL